VLARVSTACKVVRKMDVWSDADSVCEAWFCIPNRESDALKPSSKVVPPGGRTLALLILTRSHEGW